MSLVDCINKKISYERDNGRTIITLPYSGEESDVYSQLMAYVENALDSYRFSHDIIPMEFGKEPCIIYYIEKTEAGLKGFISLERDPGKSTLTLRGILGASDITYSIGTKISKRAKVEFIPAQVKV